MSQIPKEHFKMMETWALKAFNAALKDPNVIGWSIRYAPTCNDPSIQIHKIPSTYTPDKLVVEVLLCLSIRE